LVQTDVSWEGEGVIFPLANQHLLGICGTPSCPFNFLLPMQEMGVNTQNMVVLNYSLILSSWVNTWGQVIYYTLIIKTMELSG
jgi:hypothetical protein